MYTYVHTYEYYSQPLFAKVIQISLQALTYPAANSILHTTRCQYSVAKPILMVATEKTKTLAPSSFVLDIRSAKTPRTMPEIVKTAMKLGPARSW